MSLLEIECRLRPVAKYEPVMPADADEKRKFGSYHGSYFWNV